MSIPFTQYLRPDGRPKPESIDRPAEIEALALKVVEAGGRFECEVLVTGEVSFEVVRAVLSPESTHTPECEYETLASEIVPNGPAVPEAVDRLVKTAYAKISSAPTDPAPGPDDIEGAPV